MARGPMSALQQSRGDETVDYWVTCYGAIYGTHYVCRYRHNQVARSIHLLNAMNTIEQARGEFAATLHEE